MGSRAKVDKIGAKPESPFAFRTTGNLEHDMRINVFGQEFLVHSCLMKAHSAFFAKFLDSSDKAGKAAGSGRYRYEWLTKVDDDGKDWYLIADPTAEGKVGDLIAMATKRTA